MMLGEVKDSFYTVENYITNAENGFDHKRGTEEEIRVKTTI